MKTLDTFSKRILVAAVSVSLVLLSLSAFMLTVQRVTAEPKQVPSRVTPTCIGIGVDVVKGVGYVGAVGPDGGVSVYKVPLPPY